MRYISISYFCTMLALFFSCAPGDQQIAQKPSTYFNVDSLLTASVNGCLLQSATVTVEKLVSIDEEEEVKQLTMDSAALAKEVDIFRLLDINKPNLTFSYDESIADGVIAYQLKEREKQEGIINLKITTEGERTIVEGEFVEENSLYFTSRKMRLVMVAGCLKYYQVAGTQKMTFKDTVNFTLKGAIID